VKPLSLTILCLFGLPGSALAQRNAQPLMTIEQAIERFDEGVSGLSKKVQPKREEIATCGGGTVEQKQFRSKALMALLNYLVSHRGHGPRNIEKGDGLAHFRKISNVVKELEKQRFSKSNDQKIICR
jgi:hypothetical protein